LLPGNPAVADHYRDWMREIESAHPEVAMSYSTSYTLFPRRLGDTAYERAVRAHHEATLLSLGAEGPVDIIAHSVGSYFALRLLESHPERVRRVTIIFPYLGKSNIWWMRFIWIPYALDRFVPLAEAVSWCKRLFQLRDPEARNISRRELVACLRFGVRQCEYFRRCAFDFGGVAPFREKIRFLYTEPDRWCPPETVEALKPISAHRRVSIPHDFIVSPTHRAKMIQELGTF
jgi:pimeloyl-ACP methyl ester carboxylesterase